MDYILLLPLHIVAFTACKYMLTIATKTHLPRRPHCNIPTDLSSRSRTMYDSAESLCDWLIQNHALHTPVCLLIDAIGNPNRVYEHQDARPWIGESNAGSEITVYYWTNFFDRFSIAAICRDSKIIEYRLGDSTSKRG